MNGAMISEAQDCGAKMFDPETQDTHAGGSGCGCAGSLFCGHFYRQLETGTFRRILFAATGALLSPMLIQQGESIPSISHLVEVQGIVSRSIVCRFFCIPFPF